LCVVLASLCVPCFCIVSPHAHAHSCVQLYRPLVGTQLQLINIYHNITLYTLTIWFGAGV
jgi:hypothetical protein